MTCSSLISVLNLFKLWLLESTFPPYLRALREFVPLYSLSQQSCSRIQFTSFCCRLSLQKSFIGASQCLPLPTPFAKKSKIQTFHLFPQLLKELQLQIWEFAAFSSRICDLARYFVPSSDLEGTQRRVIKGVKAEPLAPSILYACIEARQAAMKYYSLVFANHYWKFVKCVYINFACNAFRITCVVFIGILLGSYIEQSDDVFARLKFLIVDRPLEYSHCMEAFLVFRSLNSLVIEDSEGEPSLNRRVERVMLGCIVSMSLNTCK
jgi:hypothetical protein